MVTLLRGVLVLAALSLGACATFSRSDCAVGGGKNDFTHFVVFYVNQEMSGSCTSAVTITTRHIGRASSQALKILRASRYGDKAVPAEFAEEKLTREYIPILFLFAVGENRPDAPNDWTYVAVADVTGSAIQSRVVVEIPQIQTDIAWRVKLEKAVAAEVVNRLRQ